MNRRDAFKLCQELNPPLYPPQPFPYGVRKDGKEYNVIHLPTKKIVKKEK